MYNRKNNLQQLVEVSPISTLDSLNGILSCSVLAMYNKSMLSRLLSTMVNVPISLLWFFYSPQFFILNRELDVCTKLPAATWTGCAETPPHASTWSVSDKQEWSARCAAPWPCAKSKQAPCSKDYSPSCPVEFIEIDHSGLCEIPKWYLSK